MLSGIKTSNINTKVPITSLQAVHVIFMNEIVALFYLKYRYNGLYTDKLRQSGGNSYLIV